MYRSAYFRDFDEDPFFSMHRDRMRQTDDMFQGFFGADHPMAIMDGRSDDRRHRGDDRYHHGDDHYHRSRGERSRELEPHRSRDSQLAPRDPMFDPFSFMNSMMSNMHSMMGNVFQQMEHVQNDPNSHSYVQSSVMTYNNTGQGEPKIYQATTATRQAPGGIKETKKAVRDSEVGIEKMAIGRHLNDRGHVIMRQRNTRTGDMDENRDYLNLDESEAGQFDDEWRQRTSQFAARPHHGQAVSYEPRSHHRALDDRHRRGYDQAPRRTTNKSKAIEQGRRVEKAY